MIMPKQQISPWSIYQNFNPKNSNIQNNKNQQIIKNQTNISKQQIRNKNKLDLYRVSAHQQSKQNRIVIQNSKYHSSSMITNNNVEKQSSESTSWQLVDSYHKKSNHHHHSQQYKNNQKNDNFEFINLKRNINQKVHSKQLQKIRENVLNQLNIRVSKQHEKTIRMANQIVVLQAIEQILSDNNSKNIEQHAIKGSDVQQQQHFLPRLKKTNKRFEENFSKLNKKHKNSGNIKNVHSKSQRNCVNLGGEFFEALHVNDIGSNNQSALSKLAKQFQDNLLGKKKQSTKQIQKEVIPYFPNNLQSYNSLNNAQNYSQSNSHNNSPQHKHTQNSQGKTRIIKLLSQLSHDHFNDKTIHQKIQTTKNPNSNTLNNKKQQIRSISMARNSNKNSKNLKINVILTQRKYPRHHLYQQSGINQKGMHIHGEQLR